MLVTMWPESNGGLGSSASENRNANVESSGSVLLSAAACTPGNACKRGRRFSENDRTEPAEWYRLPCRSNVAVIVSCGSNPVA